MLSSETFVSEHLEEVFNPNLPTSHVFLALACPEIETLVSFWTNLTGLFFRLGVHSLGLHWKSYAQIVDERVLLKRSFE